MSRDDYNEYTVSELKHLCRTYGIYGYSRLHKEGLINLVREFFKNKKFCRKKLNNEIDKNMKKFHEHRLNTRQQALAISYKNTIKKNNVCMLFYQ